MRVATDADSVIAGVFSDVAELLTGTGLLGHELRERQHFDPLTKDAFERHTGARPISRTLRTPDFPGVGPVDVEHSARPAASYSVLRASLCESAGFGRAPAGSADPATSPSRGS